MRKKLGIRSMQHKEKIFNISLRRKIKMEIKENKIMHVKKSGRIP